MGPSMLGSALQMARRKPMQDRQAQGGLGGYGTAGSIGGVMPGASPGGWGFQQHGGGHGNMGGLLHGALSQLQHGHGQGPQIDTGSIGGGIGQIMGGNSPWGHGGEISPQMPMGQPRGQLPFNPGAIGPMGGMPGMMNALGRGAPMARPSIGRAVR